jgi:hypothetical protein
MQNAERKAVAITCHFQGVKLGKCGGWCTPPSCIHIGNFMKKYNNNKKQQQKTTTTNNNNINNNNKNNNKNKNNNDVAQIMEHIWALRFLLFLRASFLHRLVSCCRGCSCTVCRSYNSVKYPV